MNNKRIKRVNSLLKEVISEVILLEVRDPNINGKVISVINVDVSKDLRSAIVYIRVNGSEKEKEDVLNALKCATGFISVTASRKIVICNFPRLVFRFDTTLESHLHINDVLDRVYKKREQREITPNENS